MWKKSKKNEGLLKNLNQWQIDEIYDLKGFL